MQNQEDKLILNSSLNEQKYFLSHLNENMSLVFHSN